MKIQQDIAKIMKAAGMKAFNHPASESKPFIDTVICDIGKVTYKHQDSKYWYTTIVTGPFTSFVPNEPIDTNVSISNHSKEKVYLLSQSNQPIDCIKWDCIRIVVNPFMIGFDIYQKKIKKGKQNKMDISKIKDSE